MFAKKFNPPPYLYFLKYKLDLALAMPMKGT